MIELRKNYSTDNWAILVTDCYIEDIQRWLQEPYQEPLGEDEHFGDKLLTQFPS